MVTRSTFAPRACADRRGALRPRSHALANAMTRSRSSAAIGRKSVSRMARGESLTHSSRRLAAEEPRDEHLCLRLNAREMLAVAERLRVQLVDVLRAGRPDGKPSVVGHDLQPADRLVVTRRVRENGADRIARQLL